MKKHKKQNSYIKQTKSIFNYTTEVTTLVCVALMFYPKLLGATVWLCVVWMLLPVTSFIGSTHGSIDLDERHRHKNHVFWFSHCYTPSAYAHAVNLVTTALKPWSSRELPHKVYILTHNNKVVLTVLNKYIQYQVNKIHGTNAVTFEAVRKPHNIKSKLNRERCHVIVFQPWVHDTLFPQNPEKLHRTVLDNFYPILNPHKAMPADAVLVVCKLIPEARRPVSCLPFALWNVRSLTSGYAVSSVYSDRHLRDYDEHVVAMLKESVLGTQRLGACHADEKKL